MVTMEEMQKLNQEEEKKMREVSRFIELNEKQLQQCYI